MRFALAFILVCLVATPVAAKAHHWNLFDLLRGSHKALEHQNIQANKEGLHRLTEVSLAHAKRSRELVCLPTSRALVVDPRLPVKYRYVRPETATFLTNFAGLHYSVWHRPLRVTSAVRTDEYQRLLRKTNGNAAKADSGLRRSSHLTGATVDITKIGMSKKELRWMQTRLATLKHEGRLEVTEEHQQAVFHIMIFKVPADAHHKPHAAHRQHRTHHGSPHRAARVFISSNLTLI